jgi:lipopolysaccharide transport system permease protein
MTGLEAKQSPASLTTTVYSPRSALAQPAKLVMDIARDLWSGRGLAWRLFLRDTSALYRQSILGYVWALIPPLVTAMTFVFLQANDVLRVAKTPVPYAAYVMVGTMLWQGFVDAFNSPMRAVATNRGMLQKVNFPREALIVAGMLDVLFNTAIRVLLLAPVFWHFELAIRPSILLFPIALAGLLLFGLSLGLLLTPIALLYSDLNRASSVLMGFWLLLTPVVYPPPRSGFAAQLSAWNPVSPVLNTTRDWLISQPATQLLGFLTVTGASLVMLFVGVLIYRVALPHLIERMGG